MLRGKKFPSYEVVALWIMGLVVLVVALGALVIAIQQGNWRLGLAGAAVLILGAVYVAAAVRGKPL